MALEYIIESLEGIDDTAKSFYKESNGKFMLDVIGVKPLSEFEGSQLALKKERSLHKEKEAALKAFGEYTPESIEAMKQELEELKLSGSGKVDDEKVEKLREMLTQRHQTELNKHVESLSQKEAIIIGLQTKIMENERSQRISELAMHSPMDKRCIPDILLRAERGLEYDEDTNTFQCKETGASINDWFQKQLDSSPWMIAASSGAGAQGGTKTGGSPNNPWLKENFNLTEQHRLLSTNPDVAKKYQAQARRLGQ